MQFLGENLNLVTLHKVKWKENGTIPKNHKETVHKGSFYAGDTCSETIVAEENPKCPSFNQDVNFRLLSKI